MTIKLQEKKIEKIAEKAALKILRQALTDPDFGLSLRPEFLKRLRKSVISKKRGLKSLSEVIDSINSN